MLTARKQLKPEVQPPPPAKSAAATLTIAELLTRLIVTSGTAAISLTLPTGTLTDAGLVPAFAVNDCFDWNLINTATSLGAVTMVAGTAHTIVGSPTVAIGTSGGFRTRKTAANTFVTYRLH